MHTSIASDVGMPKHSFHNGHNAGMTEMNEQAESSQDSEIAGYLMGSCGPANGMVVALLEGSHVIGRGAHATIYLQDDRVSREHTLVLVAAGGNVMLIDLHAGNGTRVNNSRITKAVLREGDRIEIGNSNFVFTCEHPTEGTAQTGQ